MSQDEMRNNVDQLNTLHENLEKARDELEAINIEEGLLEWEQSSFPILQSMFSLKEPYDKLWKTALNFAQKSEEWFNGMYFRNIV